MKPLYIWAGGKGKMIPKYNINPGIPLSDYDVFVEPFFGGGAMSSYIFSKNNKIKFVINDKNPEIIGIYNAIKYSVDAFIMKMDQLENKFLPLNKDNRKTFYYELRNEYTTAWQKWSPTEESAVLYFLMKTGFNGIWQTNLTSNGRFATPAGLLSQTDSCYDKQNVYEWHRFLQQVDVMCGDWYECCNKIKDKAFYFMDPPYRDSFTQYGQIFNDNDHINLIQECNRLNDSGNYVFYCNRKTDDDFYENHRGSLNIAYYPIIYTAGRRATTRDGKKEAKSAVEILLYSPRLDDDNLFS